MRKMLTFAGLMLLGSMVGCTHFDNSCSSCGGCGHAAAGNGDYHSRCTAGVCDCDLPALAPYGRGPGLVPQPLAAAPTPVTAEQTVQAPREMPKASSDTQDK